jgi:2-polyprenyl-6-methoxyphenol hydroxylase-like FAD-dependent oxidoreductase
VPGSTARVVGAADCPLIRRAATPLPGLALVGDAALTSDPAQGVGCGWAFQSAERLADAVAPALLDGGNLPAALRRYQRRRKTLNGHEWTIEQDAKAQPPDPVNRLMLKAAVADPAAAAHLDAFVNRTISLGRFLAPSAVARAMWITTRRSTPEILARPVGS